MTSFKITRNTDGRVVAICESCGATSGVPRSDMQASRWQRDHVCQPRGGRA